MSSPEPTTEPDDRYRMSAMTVVSLTVATVCITLLIIDALASAAAHPLWSREIAALFRVGGSVGLVGIVFAHVRDGSMRSMDRAHRETREQVERHHRETREQVAAVKVEVAVVRDQNEQLRELLNALIVHIDGYGENRETDGRIAAISELAAKPINGANGKPRPLRSAGFNGT
jgi:hypothetical protein